MPENDPATAAIFRQIAQQAADIALTEQAGQFSRLERMIASADHKTEVPAPMKWAAAIISAIMAAACVGIFVWLVGSVNEMQQTLVRIDERQKAQVEGNVGRFDDYERRIRRLEAYHQSENGSDK